MKIATFNINDINKRLQNLLAWLEKTEPDVSIQRVLKFYEFRSLGFTLGSTR